MDASIKLFFLSSALFLIGTFGFIFLVGFFKDNVKSVRACRQDLIKFQQEFAAKHSLSETDLESPALANAIVHFHYWVGLICASYAILMLLIGIEGIIIYFSLP